MHASCDNLIVAIELMYLFCFLYLYGLGCTGDDANKDIGTPTKMCELEEFTEKIQARRAGSQKYSGGVSMP
jgi:hypothetical protein